jgi:hypothetical protein
MKKINAKLLTNTIISLVAVFSPVYFILSSLSVSAIDCSESARAIRAEKQASNNIAGFADPCSDTCGGSSGSGEISAELSKNIPPEWGEIFSAAAEKFQINPNFLAAIFLAENGNWKPLDTQWPTSSAAASGPMQFIPGTWEAHKQDGDGDGKMDIMNPWDAVFASAHYAVGLGLKKDSKLGDIEKPFADRNSIIYVGISYNTGGGTTGAHSADEPLSVLDNDIGEGVRYGKNFHAYFTSDFTKAGEGTGYPDPNPEGAVGSTPETPGPEGCSGASSGGTTDVVELAKKVQSGVYGAQMMSDLKGGITGIDCSDCVMFVTTVYVGAGYPAPFGPTHADKVGMSNVPKFTGGQGTTTGGYFYDNGNYEEIPNSEKQAGDILVWSGHVAIYAGGNIEFEGGVNRPGNVDTDGACNIDAPPLGHSIDSATILRFKGTKP